MQTLAVASLNVPDPQAKKVPHVIFNVFEVFVNAGANRVVFGVILHGFQFALVKFSQIVIRRHGALVWCWVLCRVGWI